MAHPLIHKVQSIRRRATRLGIYYAVAAVLAAVTAAIIVVAYVDYAIGIHDRGVRLMCSVAVWLVLVASVRSFLVPALRRRWSDLGVSQRLERHFPQLSDRLSNAIAFLAQREDDVTSGSAELRRAVIAQAEAQVAPLDLSDVLDARGPRRMVGVAALVTLAAVFLSVTYPTTSSLAARRLLLPWGKENWPPVHGLAFERPPDQVTIGSDVQFTVVDRSGRLPDSVNFYYRYEEDNTVWARQMTFQSGKGKTVHELKNVTRSLQYRAEGGDDRSMPWQSLTVVEPLRIESLDIQLIPPAYTGWPTAAARGQIHALEGTEVKLTARATRPLAEARVKVLSGEETSELVAELALDRRQLRVPGSSGQKWWIRNSGAYWFELRDLEGTEGGAESRSAIQAVPDNPPDVVLEQPSADAFATANGVLPLRAKVQDDLAIHTIQLDYGRSDRANQAGTTVNLYQGPAQVQPTSQAGVDGPRAVAETRRVDFDWDLSRHEGLEPGAVLDFHLTARDYKPQETRSDVRRVTIITAQELDTRIAQRQADIRQRLEKVARLERGIRAQVSAIGTQWTETGRVKSPDLDQLRSAEWNQRDVELQLAGPDDSIQQHIAALLAMLEMNRAELPQTQDRLRRASRAIESLQREHLSAIEKHLVASRKAAQTMVASSDSEDRNESNVDASQDSPSEVVKAVVATLGEAGQHQDAVIARLAQLLEELTEADNYQQLVRDMHVLDEDHEELMRRSESLRRMTLSRQLDRLSPEERSDLQQLSHGQYELARRFDKLLDRMRPAQGPLPETDSSADQAIADTLAAAERLGVAARMHEAGRSIEHNQLGRVAVQHQEIDDALGEMSQILAGRQVSQRLVQAQLAALAKALEDAIQRQNRLIDQTVSWEELRAKQGPLAAHQFSGMANLAAEQRRLAADTAALSPNVVQLPVFHLALQGANHQMTIAANRLAGHDTSPQTQRTQKEALAHLLRMTEALKSERMAGDARALADDTRHPDAQAERPAADARAIVPQLKLLKKMQVSVYERTAAIEEARRGGGLSPQLGQELELLAHEQGQLAELLVALTSGAATPDEQERNALPRDDEKGGLDELDRLLEQSRK
jgi:hypothetical protein